MCHLLYSGPGTAPTREQLNNACVSNRDGYGWAAVTPMGLVIHKTMVSTESVETFLVHRTANPDQPMLWHSRLATHGTEDVFNVHPFYLGRDRKTVVAHNGIFGGVAIPHKDDRRSDTHKFAQSILPGWGHLDQPGVMRKVADFCGYGNKLVILTANTDKYQYPAYIINQAMGTWSDEGCWHSNRDHEGFSRHYIGYGQSPAGSRFYGTPIKGATGRTTPRKSSLWDWECEADADWRDSTDDMREIALAALSQDVRNGVTDDDDDQKWIGGKCLYCPDGETYHDMCVDCGLCMDCGMDFVGGDCTCHVPQRMRDEIRVAMQ